MAYKVLYFDEVIPDIKDAKGWYRNHLKGLEKRFAEDIKSVFPDCKIRLRNKLLDCLQES